MSSDYLMGCIMSISVRMQNFITIFHSVQEIGPFSLFQNLELGKASTKNVISQSLGLELDNINVYAKVYQNIPLSSRDGAIFTISEFEPRQRLGQSQITFDNLLDYILSISMRIQNFIKIFQTVQVLSAFFTNRPASKFSQTRRRQNLHKLSGDKIKYLIIGHSMKFNFKFQLALLEL